MNLDNILNDDYYMFLDEQNDVAFYSLTIGLEEYFSTYHKMYLHLSKDDRNDKERINKKCEAVPEYAKNYLNVAIHVQHFFELETKRILEKENPLYALEDKGDPLILHKLINNIPLDADDIKNLKSSEFSEAIIRLKKLVEKGIITDDVALIFVDNIKVLKALNQLRNTIIHRGKRIMLYCDLDDLFSQYVLPVIKMVLECAYYKKYSYMYEKLGYYDAISNIIAEGTKPHIEYHKIAYAKEVARCTQNMSVRKIEKGCEDKEYISQVVERHMEPCLEERHEEKEKCPCCENNSMFVGRVLVDYDYDELGDEMDPNVGFEPIKIPIYLQYHECGLCGFVYTDFLEI